MTWEARKKHIETRRASGHADLERLTAPEPPKQDAPPAAPPVDPPPPAPPASTTPPAPKLADKSKPSGK